MDNDEPHTNQSPADEETHTPLQGLAVMSSSAPPAAPTSKTDDELLCQDCRLPVKPGRAGVRVRSVANKRYQCGNCNSKRTVLSYALGGWPSAEFREWDEDTKVQFYRNLHGNDRTIQRHYARTLAQIQLKRKIDRDTTELRPLQYWFNSGYDAERLKSFTPKEDQVFSEQLGWQYRVKVNTHSEETEVVRVMEDILSKMTHRKAVKADGKDSKAKTMPQKRKLSKAVSATHMSSVSSSHEKNQKQKTATKQAPKHRGEKDEEMIIKAKKKDTEKVAKDSAGASV